MTSLCCKSNANFDFSVSDLSDFVDSTEKNDVTVQPTLVTTDRIEDKRIDLTHEEIMHRITWSNRAGRNCARFLLARIPS